MGDAIRPRDELVFELPPRLEDWLPPEHPARFVRDVVAALDLAALGFHVRDYNEGRSPYSAVLLLRVWLYGFFERYRSTRRLEWACRNVLPLLWLTGNQPPDHNTLWRFFRRNKKALRTLFRRVTQLAAETGLVGMVLHAIDGTKIPAACSSDTAWHKEALTKALKHADQAIEKMLDGVHDDPATIHADLPLPPALRDATARRNAIQKALQRLAVEHTDHLHPGDPQARMMKGRGTATTLSYNAQVVVDETEGLVVAEDVSSDENDQQQLNPMLDATEKILGTVADTTVVDSGYAQGEQVEQLHERERETKVLLQGLEPSAESRNQPFHKSNFRYDAERDEYVCPRGDFLPFERLTHKGGRAHEVAVYRCGNTRCPERHLCTGDAKGRTVDRTPYDEALEKQRALQRKNPEAKGLLARRKALVEVVFAILKWNQGFRRFTVKGLENVRTQWALLCTVFNLRKLYGAWVEGRLPLRAVA